MTEMERVWERLKDSAAFHATSGSLISANAGRDHTLAIRAEEFRQQPSAEAIDYLADELLRLSLEANGKLGVRP